MQSSRAVTKPDEPGLAVLIRKDGQIVFERGYGVRDLQTRAKIDAATNFRLASVTKQFTATAIMLLVRDGKLTYDTKLTDVFPDFPAHAKDITIRNLLNHTSGLPDYEDLMTAAETPGKAPIWSDTRQIQDAEVLKLLEYEKTSKFRPGTKWAYSNSGYVVLGAIVAKLSGKSYPEFLHDRIFAPLGIAELGGVRERQERGSESRVRSFHRQGSVGANRPKLHVGNSRRWRRVLLTE